MGLLQEKQTSNVSSWLVLALESEFLYLWMSVKNQPILHFFGKQNLEEMRHKPQVIRLTTHLFSIAGQKLSLLWNVELVYPIHVMSFTRKCIGLRF